MYNKAKITQFVRTVISDTITHAHSVTSQASLPSPATGQGDDVTPCDLVMSLSWVLE